MAIACGGYRVVGSGHHQTTFEALPLALGSDSSRLAVYFDTCRRKRNQLDYDLAGVIAETEADEISSKANELKRLVEAWIAEHHPQFRA